MELLNHLVAANLMKTAEMFERIGQHGAMRQLEQRSHGPALSVVELAPRERPLSRDASELPRLYRHNRTDSPCS